MMKKDQKFLNELESKLKKTSKKNKETIIKRYRDYIDSELKNKKRIVDILKEIGSVDEVAKKELNELKNNSKMKSLSTKVKGVIKKEKNKKDIKETKEEKKKIKEEKKKNKLERSIKKDKKEKLNKKEKSTFKEKLKSLTNTIKSKLIKSKNKIKHAFTKQKIKHGFKNAFNFKKHFKTIKSKLKKDKRKKKVKEVIDIVEEATVETVEAAAEITREKIFEKRSAKIIRIILQFIGVIIIIVLLFAFLFAMMVFTASLFAILDGIRFYGLNVLLFAIAMLLFWILLVISKAVFRKKIYFKVALFSVIAIFATGGIAIAFAFREFSKVDTIKDVSEKYSMTSSYETYNLPKDKIKYVTFNSEYDTQYILDYDNKLENKFKVEVKYYECYYDFYAKNSTSNLYVSLGTDVRDRISVYLENLKENKIFDANELKRYTVRIIINPKDKDRIVIN